jgi:hypothetical protein
MFSEVNQDPVVVDLGLACRILLVLPAVMIALTAFNWEGLRFLTSEADLRLSSLLAIPMQRLSFDTLEWEGKAFQFTSGCTFVHVYFASIPFLWISGRSLVRNMLRVAAFAPCFFLLNIARLAAGDLAYLHVHGLPWDWAHELSTGVAYFVVWLGLFEWRDW